MECAFYLLLHVCLLFSNEHITSIQHFLLLGVQVRLNGPKDYFGTVEVVKDGQVGTVCDYDWTKNDARVLCRELNFPDGRPYKRSFYGAGKGSVVLSGFFCDGKEDRLLDCSSRGWYNVQSYCNSHQNDASVYCYRRGEFGQLICPDIYRSELQAS